MSRRKPRGLRPEEEDLWQRVRATARPLHDVPRKPRPEAEMRNEPQEATRSSAPKVRNEPLAPFRIGQGAGPGPSVRTDLVPDIATCLGTAPAMMDKRSFARLKRGKLKPEARIDLHGMTLAQAHPALLRFILNSQAQGRRLVLVITGKGKERADAGPIPHRTGLLRHQVPAWLSQPPLSAAVLQVAGAHIRHGGAGAYYVYLRRSR